MLRDARGILADNGWSALPKGDLQRSADNSYCVIFDLSEDDVYRAEVALAQLVADYSSLEIRVESHTGGKRLVLDLLDVRSEFTSFVCEHEESNIRRVEPMLDELQVAVDCAEGFVIRPIRGAVEFVFRFLCSTDAYKAVAAALSKLTLTVRIQIFNLSEAAALDPRFHDAGWVLIMSPGE